MEDEAVNSRKWVRLFLTTLLIGGIATAAVGIVLNWKEFGHLLVRFEVIEFLAVLLWHVGVGFIFSVISQAGFLPI